MPPESQPPAFFSALQFLRRFRLRIAAISSALLIPCFWHSTIQAGDLASHVYNAWLAQLIERGQAPGLWLARQSNNVLFDLALLHLGNWVGLRAAERIAVCAAVLIFLWGAFALVSAFSGRAEWRVIALLAMLAYGWTFSQGFFNYYISVGLAFWALAIIVGCRGNSRWLALALSPAIWMAHLLGVALLAAVATYILVRQNLSPVRRAFLFVAAAASILGARVYLARHARVLLTPDSLPAYLVHANGTDQLILYGARYRIVAYLLLLLIGAAICADRFRGRRPDGMHPNYRLPIELFALALAAGYLLPWVIFLQQYGGPLGMLTERLSLVTAVFGCLVFCATQPKLWHSALLAAVSLIFFLFLYQDTSRLDRMERQARELVSSLPQARVIGVIQPPPGSRVLIHHVVDRACIGICFSYGNYEPSSRSFRVRAAPGNPYVTAEWEESEAIRVGSYTIKAQEAPIYEIYECDPPAMRLCGRQLVAIPNTDNERDSRDSKRAPDALSR